MLEELRAKHPLFIYKSFAVAELSSGFCTITYHFSISSSIEFSPTITIPVPKHFDRDNLRMFAFHLGMVELLSYWKCCCSPVVRIEAGFLDTVAIQFWTHLIRHGLGEFYFVNKIDFTIADFVQIEVKEGAPIFTGLTQPGTRGDLILVGGGKDSCVSLELLKSACIPFKCLIVNPIRAAIDSAALAGDSAPFIIKRKIDPKLLELNQLGYLNGHTPFSAMLTFLGVMVASLHGYQHVIASNESSANEANIEYLGMSVNHQYSKSYDFEVLSGQYINRLLTPHTKYFSFLRPLFELQISHLFSQFPRYFKAFRSCNVNQQQDSWCCRCPKCCFVYLCLRPFISQEQVFDIFGAELFLATENEKIFLDLAGFGDHKPLECVGTYQESREAIAMAADKKLWPEGVVPQIVNTITTRASTADKSFSVLSSWNEETILSEQYQLILREALQHGK